MITVKDFPDRTFATKTELFKAIVDNLPELMALKKSAFKLSDGLSVVYTKDDSIDKEFVVKEEGNDGDNPTEIRRKVVMNTTGLLDSHGDVHIKEIWKKSLSHNNRKLHLQEHKRDFDKVITNDAEAYTKTMTWKSLGAEFDGSTQALIFNSLIKQSRNPLMFEQYKNGWVENHSVGMQYIDYVVCINSEENWAKDYKDNWDKYYPEIVNKDAADASGYFWAILEAKLVEGSAVLFGSNWVTPTLENKEQTANAPAQTEPIEVTQEQEEKKFTFLKLKKDE